MILNLEFYIQPNCQIRKYKNIVIRHTRPQIGHKKKPYVKQENTGVCVKIGKEIQGNLAKDRKQGLSSNTKVETKENRKLSQIL